MLNMYDCMKFEVIIKQTSCSLNVKNPNIGNLGYILN